MHVALLLSVLFSLFSAEPISVSRVFAPSTDPPTRVFVSVETMLAARLDTFTVLDVRGAGAYRGGHLPGAVRVSWLDYRNGWGRTGRLQEDLTALATRMAALGVDETRPVVVYGEAIEGWGEEGRIAWMLRYLGHANVTVLDGGYGAWTRAGGEVTQNRSPIVNGRFVARVVSRERATAEDVAGAATSGAVVLDTRSLDEWNGSRRYWPSRTGRIPGAVHLHWSTLLAADGTLNRSPATLARLTALGLDREKPIIAYCVGGVRSAFVALALRELGFADVRNYDGSWYEWSADRRRPVEKPS